MDPLTSLIIPGLRRGLKQSTDTVKKGFISLLAHVVSVLGIPTRALTMELSMAEEGCNEGTGSWIMTMTAFLTPYLFSHTYPHPSPLASSHTYTLYRHLFSHTYPLSCLSLPPLHAFDRRRRIRDTTRHFAAPSPIHVAPV